MDKYIKDKKLDSANMQTELKKLIVIFRDWELIVKREIYRVKKGDFLKFFCL